MWLFWLVLSLVLLIVEIITVSFLAFFPAIGAFLAYIATLFNVELTGQIVIFAVSTSLLIIFMKPLMRKFINTKDVRTNANSVVSKTGVVTETIDTLNNKGTVKVDGELWSAISEKDDEIIQVGEKIIVTKLKGVKVIVKKI